jgi:hypothetical protein|mmetsp:Transcript_8671/g.32302  ORF Transcript_8671/g.32302 Transcript_8671/m.32302 type:complete len:449 (-) Transcript_8671:116-1462(-)
MSSGATAAPAVVASAAPAAAAAVAAAAARATPMVYHPGMVAAGVVPYMPAVPRAPAADVVGNSFVNQFYTILHTSPAVLFRFYTNDSTLIVSGDHGAGSDAPTTYRTQRDIHNKVMSMRYDETQADVKSIDASHTLGGGVLVQVTGTLRRKGESFAHNFVQSFLLAPQENGFFVLNDIVRYLDKVDATSDGKQGAAKQGAKQGAAAGAATTAAAAVAIAPASAETKTIESKASGAAGKKDGEKTAATKDAKAAKGDAAKEDDSKVDDPNKPRTYAMMAAQAAARAAEAAQAVKPAAQVAAPSKPQSPPAAEKTERAASPVVKPGCGIFIKNIFIDTTVEDLEQEFSKFGVVRGGAKGINLKSPKLSHETKFAFINFEDAASAQAALEARIELAGKELVVELKKSTTVNAKGVSNNGKRESKGRGSNGESGGERKKQPKKSSDGAEGSK